MDAGLCALGVAASAPVGLCAPNCAEWVLLDAALLRSGRVSVPLYDTLGPDAVAFIAAHADVAAVGVAAAQLATLLAALPRCPALKLVVVFGHRRDGPLPGAPGVAVVSWEALRAAGRAAPVPPRPGGPGDVATICYTSGTTGNPKGAVLTHANFVANAAAMELGLDQGVGDVHISYLPLAHIYERVLLYTCLHTGTAVGFYRGDVLGLLDDMAALQPTIFASVPRLLNRIYDKVLAGVRAGGPLSRALFARACAAKRAAMAQGRPCPALWDRLVFSKLRAKLGGRVRLISTGSAPIAPEVLDFLRVAFGGVVFEGYGMTETACLIAKTEAADLTAGHCGPPAACCEIKLVDVPEMQYRTTDVPAPRGEIWVRGPSVFSGYHKDPAQTAEVLDDAGWLHTGDIGAWLAGGRLKIIDRKKNIFKLAQVCIARKGAEVRIVVLTDSGAQGEYVAPEKIENVYLRAPLVASVFVTGDSLAPCLVAVVVPDEEALVAWARGAALPAGAPADVRALCADPRTAAAVLDQMNREADRAGLRSFERAKAVHLVAEPWTVEGGLITPSFKLKRPQARAFFKPAIDAMYAALGPM